MGKGGKLAREERKGEERDVRFAGTLRTANVLAAFAHGRSAGEEGVAFVAVATHALLGVFAVHLVAGLAVEHLEGMFGSGFLVVLACCSETPDGRFLALAVFGRALGGEAGALLAARVVAVRAELVGPEGRLASVALPVHAHADFLLHSLRVVFQRWGPFAGFEGEAVLLEEGASSLFLDLVVFGCGGCVFGSALGEDGCACFAFFHRSKRCRCFWVRSRSRSGSHDWGWQSC